VTTVVEWAGSRAAHRCARPRSVAATDAFAMAAINDIGRWELG
jgi:hypothetical protein